jgi:hypothetical protein
MAIGVHSIAVRSENRGIDVSHSNHPSHFVWRGGDFWYRIIRLSEQHYAWVVRTRAEADQLAWPSRYA